MEKLLGFPKWHVRPRLTAASLLAGAYCLVRWGDHEHFLLVELLHALPSVMCLYVELYRALPWVRARYFLLHPTCPCQLFSSGGTMVVVRSRFDHVSFSGRRTFPPLGSDPVPAHLGPRTRGLGLRNTEGNRSRPEFRKAPEPVTEAKNRSTISNMFPTPPFGSSSTLYDSATPNMRGDDLVLGCLRNRKHTRAFCALLLHSHQLVLFETFVLEDY